MKKLTIQIKSSYGEVINCSIKEVIIHPSGRVTHKMDNKSVNTLHNSLFDSEACDCRVRSVELFASGKYEVFASYKNNNGSYKQGSQVIDAEIIE
jgi:hypothetical protein